jgi:signal peptidase II
LFVAAALVALDRASKSLVETRLAPWDVVPVFAGHFQIISARNTGMAFSVFDNGGRTSPLLIVFTIAIITVVAWLLWQSIRPNTERTHWSYRLALGFILGGAFGNLYDRLVYGSVTDFLDFYWGAAHFPAFNAADSAITCGAALIVANLWFARRDG